MSKEGHVFDNIEMVLQAINDLEIRNSEQFQEWIKDADSLRLYNELLLYRMAILEASDTDVPSDKLAWEEFEKKKIRRKIKLSPLWIAGVAVIVALFFTIRGFWEQNTNTYPAAIPEFVAQNVPQQITLQADDGVPVVVEQKIKTVPDSVDNTEQLPVTHVSSIVINRNVQTYTLSIPRGKSYHLVLEDSTEVWLNADSKLKFPDKFAANKREVELVGEGYFKVKKDAGRPFIVKSEYLTTRVLGTEFNFRAYNKKDAGVTLVSGKVVVTNSDTDSTDEVVLNPNQTISLVNDVLEVSDVDVRKYTSWVEGLFYFDDATLEDIMKELGRWYNVNIEFEDRQTKNYRFKFWADRSRSFKQATDMLNQIGKVSIEIYGNRAIIKEK